MQKAETETGAVDFEASIDGIHPEVGVDSHDLEIAILPGLFLKDLSARDFAISQGRLYDLNVRCLGISNQIAS